MNITLEIDKIHVRYEDDIYPYFHPFSFGICVEKLKFEIINNEWHVD